MRYLLLFLVSLSLWGCSDEASYTAYDGGLFKGEYVLVSADISGLQTTPLSSSLKGVEGYIDTRDELRQMIAWVQNIDREIREAPKGQQFGKRASLACELAGFMDVGFISHMSKSLQERQAYFKNEPDAKASVEVMTALSDLVQKMFTHNLATSKLSTADEKAKMYHFLKQKCPAYSAFLAAAEKSFLDEIDGFVDTPKEHVRMLNFVDRARQAIVTLPDTMRLVHYADVVCQMLARTDISLPENAADLMATLVDESPKATSIRNMRLTLREAFYKNNLKKLGLGSSKQDERRLSKELAKSCPLYMDYVEMKRKKSDTDYELTKELFN
jgi:hypothetical protein